jgi:hypothetical protein
MARADASFWHYKRNNVPTTLSSPPVNKKRLNVNSFRFRSRDRIFYQISIRLWLTPFVVALKAIADGDVPRLLALRKTHAQTAPGTRTYECLQLPIRSGT